MSVTKKSTSSRLNFINARRKRGDVTSVAGKTSFSPSYVSNVLAGRRTNDTIVEAMYTKVSRRKPVAA